MEQRQMKITAAPNMMRDAALEYARPGWPLLPLDAGYAPLEHQPTSDAVQIVLWWSQYPQAQPGLVLGRPIGQSLNQLVALVDCRTSTSLAYLNARGVIDSLGDGHLIRGLDRAWIFASPMPMPSRELAPGLAVIGDGVLPLPPSNDARGEWRWRKGFFLPDRALASAPHWLRVAEPEPALAANEPEVSKDWVSEIKRNKTGAAMPTLANAALILRCDERWAGRLSYDEMSMSVAKDGRSMEDAEVVLMRETIERRYGASLSDALMRDALLGVAHARRFNPVKTYLNSLKWDGVSRIARVLEEVLGIVDPTALDHAMIRSWFISAVARPMRPGCKVDTALVLVGPQGAFKSTFFRVLTEPWFSDSYMDITNKDSLMQLASAWIYEWPEIEAVTNSRQAGDIKKFITSQFDTFRSPFARAVRQVPRTGLIVGTTNEDRFLNDDTGSRRFWILHVRRTIRSDRLKHWRDQLWAEAMAALGKDEPWWLDKTGEIEREQRAEEFSIIDPWDERVANWLVHHDEKEYTAVQIMSDALSLPTREQHSGASRRVGRIMRKLGFTRVKSRPIRSGVRLPPTWVWIPPNTS
jgi:hypothetical protein